MFVNLLVISTAIVSVIEADVSLKQDQLQIQDEKVNIQLYYECLCPYCRYFDTNYWKDTYNVLQNYLNVTTYPYGKAKTITFDNGTVEFECQHGPEECYGNKLHACAIDILDNTTASINFNACLMDFSNEKGSDDPTADKCGQELSVDVDSIKECAKGEKGTELLKYYGEESKKIGFQFVPYILINGAILEPYGQFDFMHLVCSQFKNWPPPCDSELQIYQL